MGCLLPIKNYVGVYFLDLKLDNGKSLVHFLIATYKTSITPINKTVTFDFFDNLKTFTRVKKYFFLNCRLPSATFQVAPY